MNNCFACLEIDIYILARYIDSRALARAQTTGGAPAYLIVICNVLLVLNFYIY